VASVRRRGRRVRVQLDDEEVAILAMLTEQVLALLDDGDASSAQAEPVGADIADPDAAEPATASDDEAASLETLLGASTGPVETPRDPALLRLLPDAYRNDDDAAEEFRRLTEAGLRATKRTALQRLLDDLASAGSPQKDGGIRYDLDHAATEAWLPALTDLRLVFGTRIGVTDDFDDERAIVEEDSLRYAEIAAYDWMSWLQDAIVRALIGD
jgi:Domain of unknown function (DUF2017)